MRGAQDPGGTETSSVRVRNDSFTDRLWHIPEPNDHDPIPDTPYPNFVTKLLRRRGVQNAEEAGTYLFDTPFELPDANLLPSIETALARIEQAVRDDETIAVYGDFDVDGVTSSTILTEAIRAVGGRVSPYIPDRFTEGYGLNRSALQMLRERGVTLVITADCGITAIPEVTFAREIGEDVIILDHHSVPDETPDACATVNPKMPGSAYPFDEMSTGGLAYRMAHLLVERYGVAVDSDRWLDLAALSTVADVVPLMADNRWIVAEGLRAIRETPRPGLQALLDVSGLWDQELDTDSIAFGLAPRISVELLAADSQYDALSVVSKSSGGQLNRRSPRARRG